MDYKAKIQTIAADEFPTLPSLKEESLLTVSLSEWSRGVEAVSWAAAKDALRPVLTGVLLEYGKKGLKLVATDGFRLSVRQLAVAGKGWEEAVLVPARAIGEVSKLEGEEKLEILLYPDSKQVAFRVGESVVVSQLALTKRG